MWRIWFGISNGDCNALTTGDFDMNAFSSSMRSQLATAMIIDVERVLYLSIHTGKVSCKFY